MSPLRSIVMKTRFASLLLMLLTSVFGRTDGRTTEDELFMRHEQHAEHVVFDSHEHVAERFAAMVALKVVSELLTGLNATTLQDLVQKAGLQEALSAPGPLTLFVPTNVAFQELLEKEANLMNDTLNLKSILMFHAVPAELMTSSANWKNEMLLRSLQGDLLRLNVYNLSSGPPTWTVNGARILQADIKAGNGVIHVIDTVLQPEPDNVLAVLASDPKQRFTSLLQAIQKVGLNDTLNSVGPYTLFAPVNDAFKTLPAGIADALNNPEKVKQILMGHVMSGSLYCAGMANGTVRVLNGNMVNATVSSDKILLNSAEVLETDISAHNGVIHIISKLI